MSAKFEQKLRERFASVEITPRSEVWEKVESNLAEKGRKRRVIWLYPALAAAASALLLWMLWIPRSSIIEPQLSDNRPETIQPSTNDGSLIPSTSPEQEDAKIAANPDVKNTSPQAKTNVEHTPAVNIPSQKTSGNNFAQLATNSDAPSTNRIPLPPTQEEVLNSATPLENQQQSLSFSLEINIQLPENFRQPGNQPNQQIAVNPLNDPYRKNPREVVELEPFGEQLASTEQRKKSDKLSHIRVYNANYQHFDQGLSFNESDSFNAVSEPTTQDASRSSNQYNYDLVNSIDFGLAISNAIGKRLALETGFRVGQRTWSYQGSRPVLTADEVGSRDVASLANQLQEDLADRKHTHVSIPVKIVYYPIKKRISLGVAGGLTYTHTFTGDPLELEPVLEQSGYFNNLADNGSIPEPLRDQILLESGLRLSYQLSKQFGIYVSPELGYILNRSTQPEPYADLGPWRSGLQLGLIAYVL